jgi:hypothetical protein
MGVALAAEHTRTQGEPRQLDDGRLGAQVTCPTEGRRKSSRVAPDGPVRALDSACRQWGSVRSMGPPSGSRGILHQGGRAADMGIDAAQGGLFGQRKLGARESSASGATESSTGVQRKVRRYRGVRHSGSDGSRWPHSHYAPTPGASLPHSRLVAVQDRHLRQRQFDLNLHWLQGRHRLAAGPPK